MLGFIYLISKAFLKDYLIKKNTLQYQTFRIVFHPWVYLFAHQIYQSGQLNWTHYRVLLKNMTYHFLLMKENPTNLIFNLPSLCTPVVEVLAELCPDIKHVYCTRIPKASIADIDKVN